MMKKVTALLLAMLMVFTMAACGEQPDTTDEPSTKIESITVGTTAAIETATFGEYNFDMLASGVSELPLVYQDTKGEYHLRCWQPTLPRMPLPGHIPFRTA